MTLEQLTKEFIDKPYCLKQGKGYLAKRYKVSSDTILKLNPLSLLLLLRIRLRY